MSKAVKSNPSNKDDYLDIGRQVIKVLNTEKTTKSSIWGA